MNVFERKVYRRILGPVYDDKKENWRILTNKEIYANVKNPTIIETIRLKRLRWFGHVQRMEGNRIPKRVLYRVSQYLCHKLLLGIPHPKISKKVPINMGPKMNSFQDIQCCVETRKL